MSVVERMGASNSANVPAQEGDATLGDSAALAPFALNPKSLKSLGLYDQADPSGRQAREFRAIKRRLMRRIGFLRASADRKNINMPGRRRNLILVTSTRAGEGKTFCALNLALSLAIEDRIETVLVDADVQRPKVRAHLDLAPGPGLTDIIYDPAIAMAPLCRRAAGIPLSVLGEGARVGRVSELFASEQAQRVWTELSNRNRNGLVIIDAPPVLATTETVILAKYVDEIIFVVEANSTPEPAVASAIDELLDVNPNVSLMLNRCIVASGGAHFESYEYYDRDCGVKTPAKSDSLT